MTYHKYQQSLRIAPALDFEVKAEASGRIEGYASTFGGDPDRHGDIVSHGAFSRTLREHRAEKTSPAMLWSHQLESPIGKWLSIEEDSAGLFVAGQINLKTERGREAFAHVSAGDVASFSIGYVTPENGRRYLGKGAFALDDLDLVEISLVSVPANARARITQAKQLASKAEAIAFLRESGLSKSAAQRFAAGGFPALAGAVVSADRVTKLADQIDRITKQIGNQK